MSVRHAHVQFGNYANQVRELARHLIDDGEWPTGWSHRFSTQETDDGKVMLSLEVWRGAGVDAFYRRADGVVGHHRVQYSKGAFVDEVRNVTDQLVEAVMEPADPAIKLALDMVRSTLEVVWDQLAFVDEVSLDKLICNVSVMEPADPAIKLALDMVRATLEVVWDQLEEAGHVKHDERGAVRFSNDVPPTLRDACYWLERKRITAPVMANTVTSKAQMYEQFAIEHAAEAIRSRR